MNNSEFINILNTTLSNIAQGNISFIQNNFNLQQDINNIALDLLRKSNWKEDEIQLCNLILRISNILYNNTSLQTLVLSDGVYDQLLQAYKIYNPNYQIGAVPTVIVDQPVNENIQERKLMYKVVPKDIKEKSLYYRQLHDQINPIYPMRNRLMYTLNRPPIKKRMIDTQHKYPELVGTLDKCKFVMNEDARVAGVFNDSNVQVFERDFLYPCLVRNIIQPNQEFSMIGELKYDGVSVEAEVCGDRILSAYSRGDTAANIATDLTPILENYRFIRAKDVSTNEKFGIKFEAIITYRNLERLAMMRQREYKNGRNAIIGILGSSDAYRYVDCITLIPIACSLDFSQYGNQARIIELNFLNKYYSNEELNRFVYMHGDYTSILYQVREFTYSAENIRSILPYMIDGVVISFIDPQIISILGRINSVNKYQMAIKFNPREVRTIFQGYTFSIGKSGDVIPMLHFNPVEFIGTIHTKQTAHSYQRYRELALVRGQEIDIKYVNDVLTYVTKPDTQHNRELQSKYAPEPFIDKCPYCGSQIEISETFKSARCPNPNCHERKLMRLVDMIDKLGFKDISEEAIRALDGYYCNGVTSLVDLMSIKDSSTLIPILGPLTAEKFLYYINKLKNEPIRDYELMGALSFEGMAAEKWKNILKYYNIYTLLGYTYDQLIAALRSIKGVGPETIKAIYDGFNIYKDEMYFIKSGYFNIIHTMDTCNGNMPKAVITGFRNDEIIDILRSQGYDASDSYSVTKDTALVIAADPNGNSSKLQKARKYGIKIISLDEFYQGLK